MNANVLAFPERPTLKTTIKDLVATFESVEVQENPDLDVHLSALRAREDGLIEVPDLGAHALTDWARGQLGQTLGFSWDRYFAGASLPDRAGDLNRRLARAHGVVRLRTTRAKPEGIEGDGVLRAVVSRDYSTVRDSTITSLLAGGLAKVEPNARILRYSTTELTTSFVVRVGEPYRVGSHGKVGELWGALVCRNSGVGYSKLTIALHLVRLACMNGMTAPVPMPAIVRTRHRWIDEGEIAVAIHEGLVGISDKLRRGAYVMDEAVGQRVDDVEAEVREVLKTAKLPTKLVRPILSAYAREPHASRFGVSQALTLAAQTESPEVRLQLEEVAGRYLASSA
jgi:hypothetical protein